MAATDGYTACSMGNAREVLVTGGAGFVGATLVRRLVADRYRVRVLDNLSTGDAAHLDGVDAGLVVGDIRDADTLDDAVAGCHAIIHLAAAGSVIGSVADPHPNFEANVVGTFRVLDAARRHGVGRVVQASTGGALIGDATPPVDERSLPKPLSPYGASKLAGEGYAHAFAKAYGVRTVAVRFGNVYGPWCGRKRGVLNVFFGALRSGEPLVIYGDGTASRDYVHVSDIAAALQLALENPDIPGGTVLHAASGVETTIAALADLCRRAAGRPDHPVSYRPPRAGEVGRNFARYDLAHRLLGYSPTVRIEDGIPLLWKWFETELFRE
jgi:UDP-glucose 4-epimerase